MCRHGHQHPGWALSSQSIDEHVGTWYLTLFFGLERMCLQRVAFLTPLNYVSNSLNQILVYMYVVYIPVVHIRKYQVGR